MKLKDDNKSPWSVPLKTWIDFNHNGNISAFARTQHVRQDQAARWLKRDCIFENGKVYCEVSKSKKVEGES